MIVNGDEFENIEIVHNNLSEDNPYKLSGITKQHGADMNRNITSTNQKCDIIITGSTDDRHRPVSQHSLPSPSSDRDVMLEMVKNKGLVKTAKMDQRMSSIDSDMSEASTLVSVASDKIGQDDKGRQRSRINHHSIRGFVSDSETETSLVCVSFNFQYFFACFNFLGIFFYKVIPGKPALFKYCFIHIVVLYKAGCLFIFCFQFMLHIS